MIKYQIFVSSTFTDLEAGRSQVIKAILEMGHIPVGMEMFSAADEEQWKIIARQIDESDYYVVIVGHRYGSMVDGVSYTEKEFDCAVRCGIPVLGFVIDESVQPLAKDVDSEAEKVVALAAFKNKVKSRPVGFWKSSDDLHGKVSISLMKAFNTMPRVGWTRATSVAGPEVTQELSRLSKENSDLRLQLEKALRQDERDHEYDLRAKLKLLVSIPKRISLRRHGEAKWNIHVHVNLFDIFSQLAPEMMVEISEGDAADYLAVMNNKDNEKLSANAPFAFNHAKMLLADLASLGLIEPSKRKHPVSDKTVYWSLTSEGNEILRMHRVDRLSAAAKAASEKTVADASSAAKKKSVKS